MRITVHMDMDDRDVAAGWANDAELAATVRATLHELNGDDGDVYVPRVLDVEIEEES